jgi:hypothetical protein
MRRKEESFLNAVFIAEDRLGAAVERVKRKIKVFFESGRKGRNHWGKWGKTTGEENDWRKGKPIPCRIP